MRFIYECDVHHIVQGKEPPEQVEFMPHPSMGETSRCCTFKDLNEMSLLPQN